MNRADTRRPDPWTARNSALERRRAPGAKLFDMGTRDPVAFEEARGSRVVTTTRVSGNSEALAALGTTPLNHVTAVLAPHPNQKTMRAVAAAAARLIRSLHETPGRAPRHPGKLES